MNVDADVRVAGDEDPEFYASASGSDADPITTACSDPTTMKFGLLGPVEIRNDTDELIDLGGRQPRLLVAMLLTAGRTVTTDSLVDTIWGGRAPAGALDTLRSVVSRLRPRLAPAQIVWDDTGYRLDVGDAEIEHVRFEQLADQGRSLIDDDRVAEGREALLLADSLWRGRVLDGLSDLEFATGLVTRLEERRLAAIEDRVTADLALGRHAALVGELSQLVAATPFREGLQRQLALALYRSGRQADALRSLTDARRLLREELGVDPGPDLRALESQILSHDPALTAPAMPAHTTHRRIPPDQLPRNAQPLVGRTRELADLTLAVAEASIAARFVVIEGEPGIGKTRLAEELADHATQTGATVVWGRSDESGAAPALWPWLAPLRALADLVRDVPPPVRQLLTDSALPIGPASSVRFELFDGVVSILTQASADGTVMIVIEDLQWADTASLELVGFLAARANPNLIVVVTTRLLEVGRQDPVTDALAAIARRPGSRRTVIRGLSLTEMGELLSARSGRSPDPDAAATIHERADGNPFFAIELARLLDDGTVALHDVPRSVGDVLRRRLALLPATTVEVLGVAAVIGREVDVALLASSTNLEHDEVINRLDVALAHRFLVPSDHAFGTIRFSHALVREVLLEDLTSLRRSRLHLRVADAIEQRGAGIDDAEILAEHLWQAAPVGVGRRAAEALEVAGNVALGRAAYDRAEQLLERAARLRRATGTSELDLEIELATLMRLLEVERSMRYYRGADEVFLGRAQSIAERLGRRDVVLDLLWFEWSAAATGGDRERSTTLVEAYRELAHLDGGPEALANSEAVLGIYSWGDLGDVTAACFHLDRAVARWDQLPPPTDAFRGEQRLLSSTFGTYNHALRGDLSWSAASAQMEELLALVAGNWWATRAVAGFASALGAMFADADAIDHYIAVGRASDPDEQFEFWRAHNSLQGAIATLLRGDVERAIEKFVAGEGEYDALGSSTGLGGYQAMFALELAKAGHTDIAAAWVVKARTTFDVGEKWPEALVLVAEGAIAARRGDLHSAAELLEAAFETSRRRGTGLFDHHARQIADCHDLPLPC